MRQRICFVLLLACSLYASGCVTAPGKSMAVDPSVHATPVLTLVDISLFGEEMAVQSNDAIVTLSAEQEEQFLHYYNNPFRRSVPEHQRVYQYLQTFAEDFEYSRETWSASNTFANRSGNCMSLAVLTAAFAKAAGLDTEYQVINRQPVYETVGTVLFNMQHVRTVLYAPKQSIIGMQPALAFRGKAIIDYYPGRYNHPIAVVSTPGLINLYHINLAAEALGVDDNNRSFWHLKRALEITPNDPTAINMLGVLHHRKGQLDVAEELYVRGLAIANKNIPLMKNYQRLLLAQGRNGEAQQLARTIISLDDRNPFTWLQAGNDAYSDRDYSTALTFYRKAVKLGPHLHLAHMGVAKTQLARGKRGAARRALREAKAAAAGSKEESLYASKLAALGKSQ